jgi:hypothetical protein
LVKTFLTSGQDTRLDRICLPGGRRFGALVVERKRTPAVERGATPQENDDGDDRQPKRRAGEQQITYLLDRKAS